MDIELIRADITSMKVDAIVNAANSRLQHMGGVAAAIVREGGEVIQRESDRVGYVPVGGAVVTTGGNLFCKYVIHAVGPVMGEGDEDNKLRSATLSSLQRAEELKVNSLAFPAISTGIFGFPVERCARIMLGTTIDFAPHAKALQRVVYCLFGAGPYEEFERVYEELRGT
jgi:O-acetyl-ADP-ribose deacetylase (regulator of RNase III)